MPIRESGHEPETIISASVKVEGDFVSQGNVLIEGVVEGSLRTDRDLRVGERARISADVSAQNATIAGEVQGNMSVGERLELESTAVINGDIRTKVLVVASGAVMNGNVIMGQDAGADSKQMKRAKTVQSHEDAAPDARHAAPAADAQENEDSKEKRTVNAFFTK